LTHPRFTKLVAGLPSTVPFVGPEAQERARGRVFAARIGANENIFGPSPKAIEAMARAAGQVWQYGDPENHDLKIALAAHHNVAPDNVVVGEGIDGLLGNLARLLVGEGTAVVNSAGAYPTFNFHIASQGGALHSVPFNGDDQEDTQALIARARQADAALIYISNPDNPMGTWHDGEVMQRMIDRVPEGAVLCIDEAYVEFAPNGTAPKIDVGRADVIRMRTFSKAHGMAGARIGYAIAHADLALAFNKVRNHYGVNRIAQAGALASLADHDYQGETRDRVAAACNRIAEIAADNGLTPLPTATNFVAIDCGRDPDYAKAVLTGLLARDIFVRMPFVAPQTRCIRVSAGRAPELALFAQALPQVLRAI
jgi:histidinol-phosphate aminotransferase